MNNGVLIILNLKQVNLKNGGCHEINEKNTGNGAVCALPHADITGYTVVSIIKPASKAIPLYFLPHLESIQPWMLFF
jgi:hypothetical protein